jgi:hypothetical protein
MPVRNGAGQRVLIPTRPWQEFGYSLEFDRQGGGHGLTIDFGSLAELLAELDRQAQRHGLAIERIIVAPEYVERVSSAGDGTVAAQTASRPRTA